MELIYTTLTLLVVILSSLIGGAVISSNRNQLNNKLFGCFSVAASIWVLIDYTLYQKSLAPYQTFLNRFDLSIITVMVVFLSSFVTYFPHKIFNIKKWVLYLTITLNAVLILLILFSNKIIAFAFMEDYGSNFKEGPLFYLFVINVSFYAFYAVTMLIVKLFRSNHREKQQVKLMLSGIGLLCLLNMVFSLFIPMLTNSFMYARFGTYSAILFIGFTAYAILKTRIFDVRVIMTEIAVIIINVISAIQIFTSKSISEGILKALFLFVLLIGSYWLIRSVKKEILQREELEHLAKKLEEANAHLKELDELKDDFLGMASHELNSPLAAIEGYLSMILEEGIGGTDLNPQTREYLDRINKSAIRLTAIVKDLLNVSRIESGRIHLIYADIQIEDLIQSSIDEIMPKVEEMHHQITFNKPEQSLPKTWLDNTRITEVVINILSNAVKYTPDGGKIDVCVEGKGNELIISIKDTGKGIPKDKTDRVFQKFTQVDVMKDEIKGTGLGMYISKKFIELHKGKIWFESEGEGRGTAFYFSLPIIKEKPHDPNEGEGPILH